MFISKPPYQDHQPAADTPAQATGLKALFIKQKTSLVFWTRRWFLKLVSKPPYQDHQPAADTPAQAAGLNAFFYKAKKKSRLLDETLVLKAYLETPIPGSSSSDFSIKVIESTIHKALELDKMEL